MSHRSLHVTIVHFSRDKQKLARCMSSITYPGELTMSVIPVEKCKPGGLFAQVTEDWIRKGKDYVTYITSGCDMTPDRLLAQEEFMNKNDLAASYGNVGEVDRMGKVYAVEEFRPFSTEMIGVDCIDTETLLIDKEKFKSAGGFDHLLAGSCYPNMYLVTMCAVGGKIAHLNKTVVHRFLGEHRWGPNGTDLLAWNDAEAGFWKRFQFEKFVMQAREHYKSMGW